MKLLVLGSSGMMGTAMEAVCRMRHVDHTGLTHADVDITDHGTLEGAVARRRPDVVINFVALVGINPCEEHPDRAFAVHATAVSFLAGLCEELGITLVQASTHAVFDGTKDDYYTEADEPRPTSIYAGSKYLSEVFAAARCRRHYIPRFPTMFGPRRNTALGFADKMLQLLQSGREVRIAGDKIDSPTYALDAAGAVLDLVEEGAPYGVYHVANEGRVSYYDFVARMAELLGWNVALLRARDEDFPALAPKPLRTALRSVKRPPLRSWEEALREYVEQCPPPVKDAPVAARRSL